MIYLMIGTHRLCITKIQGIWCTIWKYEHEKPDMYGVRHYTYSLRFYSGNVKRVESYIRDVYLRSLSDPTGAYIVIHTKGEHSHYDFNRIKKKKLICPAASLRHKAALDRIRMEFDEDKNLKQDKLGVLLYGTPGCGKSRLIYQLASELGFNIYIINLKDFHTDAEFCTILNRVRIPGILVFEDIDCVVSNREDFTPVKDKEVNPRMSGVTLSTVLNVFDGLLTMDKQFIIATTNYPDRLDPALTRTGRFDIRCELFPLNQEDIVRFLSLFYDVENADTFLPHVKGIENVTIADLDYICRTYPLDQVGTDTWLQAMHAADIHTV